MQEKFCHLLFFSSADMSMAKMVNSSFLLISSKTAAVFGSLFGTKKSWMVRSRSANVSESKPAPRILHRFGTSMDFRYWYFCGPLSSFQVTWNCAVLVGAGGKKR